MRRSQSFNVGSHAAGGPGAKKEKVQDAPVEHDLLVTLEDICKGVTKRMKISRRVVGNDGSVRKEEKVLGGPIPFPGTFLFCLCPS